jgi:hypothetical protein
MDTGKKNSSLSKTGYVLITPSCLWSFGDQFYAAQTAGHLSNFQDPPATDAPFIKKSFRSRNH